MFEMDTIINEVKEADEKKLSLCEEYRSIREQIKALERRKECIAGEIDGLTDWEIALIHRYEECTKQPFPKDIYHKLSRMEFS